MNAKITSLKAKEKPQQRRTKGRPSLAQSIQLKETFLKTALEVFLEKGFAGSTMEGIAKQAKASKNTLYLHFKNKEELFKAAAQHALTSVNFEIDSSVYEEDSLDKVLLEIIERVQLFAMDENIRNLTRLLIAESQRFPAIAESQLDELKKMLRPVTNYLEGISITEGFYLHDPSSAALDLVVLALGGFNFLLSEPKLSEAKRKQRAKEVRNLVLNGWYGTKDSH